MQKTKDKTKRAAGTTVLTHFSGSDDAVVGNELGITAATEKEEVLFPSSACFPSAASSVSVSSHVLAISVCPPVALSAGLAASSSSFFKAVDGSVGVLSTAAIQDKQNSLNISPLHSEKYVAVSSALKSVTFGSNVGSLTDIDMGAQMMSTDVDRLGSTLSSTGSVSVMQPSLQLTRPADSIHTVTPSRTASPAVARLLQPSFSSNGQKLTNVLTVPG